MSEYTPGTWFAAVTPLGVAVLPAESDPALTRSVLATLTAGRGLAGVLETLTGAFGTSLAAIPPFAVVTREGGETRIAVRGGLTARADGAVAISGIGVTTWSERVLPGAETVTIETGDVSQPAVLELPVANGIVLISRLRVGDDDAGGASAAAVGVVAAAVIAAAPVIAPAPVVVVADALASLAEAEPEIEAAAAPASEPDRKVEPEPEPEREPEPEVEPEPEPEPEAEPEPEPEPEPEVEPEPEPEPALDDELWGATVVKSATDPAVRPSSAPVRTAERLAFMPPPTGLPVATQPGLISSVPGAVGTRPGDHDGMTISVEESRAMRLAAGTAPAASHAEVPEPASVQVPVASTARIVLSTGREVVLDRTVVIGRRPSSTRVTGGLLPHLVSVESPDQDISRSHVEIRPEGDAIVVVDLNTTNGTLLRRIGHEPVQLHPGEPSVIVQGDVLELGDDVTVTFEGIA